MGAGSLEATAGNFFLGFLQHLFHIRHVEGFFLPCFVSSLVYIFLFFSIYHLGRLSELYHFIFLSPSLLGEFETAGPIRWGKRGVERERGRWGVEKLKFRLGDESEGFDVYGVLSYMM